MSILARFKDIMSSNVNSVLDKMEDPSKMVDQLLRNLNDDLGKVTAETAGVMADEQRSKRQLDECADEINKLQSYAEKAVVAGNDSDAKAFLQKKATKQSQYESLSQSYSLAHDNSVKMKEMHDKIVLQINDLNSRKDSIKAKMSVAKTQEKINKVGASVNSAKGNISSFDRMEEKANKMMDTANAMAELNSDKDSVDDLESKYSSGATPNEVDDELAALKSKLGRE